MATMAVQMAGKPMNMPQATMTMGGTMPMAMQPQAYTAAPQVTMTMQPQAAATAMPRVTTAQPQVTYMQTSGSYGNLPMQPMTMTSGSYVPPVAASMATPSAAPASMANRMPGTLMNFAGPAVSSSMPMAGGGSYAPMPMGQPVVSGSYVPPLSGSYSAPPMMALSGSYAPPVAMPGRSGSYAAPPMFPTSGSLTGPLGQQPMYAAPAPAVPQMLTGIPVQGAYGVPGGPALPDPTTVAAQKTAYKTALDKQFAQALAQIENERDMKKALLRQTAQQQKDQFALQARSQLEGTKLQLDTQLNTQMAQLQETAMQHRKVLEEKAASLTLDFQTRKANEDLLVKQYQIQKQFVDNERQLNQEFQAKQQKPAGAAPALAPPTVPAKA